MTSERSLSFPGLVFAIALGVFIGGLGAAFAYEQILLFRAERMANKVVEELEAMRAQDKARADARAAQEAQRRAAQLQQQAQQRQAQLLADQEAKAKELAWAQYFKPSPECRNGSVNVECANAHIRARKQFEDFWRNRSPASTP